MPPHAAIQLHCRGTGHDNLAPIIRQKVGYADHEADGSAFPGKPYKPLRA